MFIGKFKTNSNIYIYIIRVILTGLIIALKYNEDIIYKQDYISSVGGVSKKELGTLEYSFLELIDYNLFVKSSDYSYCLNEIINELTSN